MDTNENAKRDLPLLTDYCRRLLDLGNKIKEKANTKGTKEDNHLGFMSFVFLGFQTENLESILLLNREKSFAVSAVISRISTEAMVKLLRSASEGQEWAYRWRSFSVVEEYWEMIKKKEKGLPCNEIDFNECETIFKTVDKLFLKDEKGSSKLSVSNISGWKSLFEGLKNPRNPMETRVKYFINGLCKRQIEMYQYEGLMDDGLKDMIIGYYSAPNTPPGMKLFPKKASFREFRVFRPCFRTVEI